MNEEPSPDDIDRLLAKLTPAERRCLELVALGMTSKDIGREMNVAPTTIDQYVKSAGNKLGVSKRILAARIVAAGSDQSAPKLIYENWGIPNDRNFANNEASAGQGDGPDDLKHREPCTSESIDSQHGPAWLEPSHPIAKFFGGENKLSLVQRIIWVITLAIGIGIGFGGLVSGLLQLSRLYSAP